MDLREFREMIVEDVKVTSASELITDKEAFLTIYTNALIEAEELVDFSLLPFEGIGKSSRKIQIDGFLYDELENCFCLFLCPSLVYDVPETLTVAEAEKLFARMKAFIEDAAIIVEKAEESAPGYGLAIDVLKRYREVDKYKLYILTDMTMSKNIKTLKSDSLQGKNVEHAIWDIERWHKLYESKTGKEEIVINMLEYTEHGIPCLPGSCTDDYTSYLCNIPGTVLASIYNTYGGRLLEGNVRSFLTAKGKVNKGIRNTISNEPHMFFPYNNGIAATANQIEITVHENISYITNISSLQIVNGGQTTASIANAVITPPPGHTLSSIKENLKRIFVPMKLSVVTNEKAQTLIPKIAEYANSQNKVSDADFFATRPFHVRIEEFSRRIIAPAVGANQFGTRWYYERAKGQYNQEQTKLSAAEKKKFQLQNPKSQMFTKTDLAKYFNIYRAIPHIVSAGAQKNFIEFANWATAEWEKNELVFNEGFYRQVIALAILFKSTDKIVKQQPWYESGYKANVVYYTLSKLFYTLRHDYPDMTFPFKAVWLKQSITKSCEDQIADLAKTIYYFLTDDNREVQNVTEWAKRKGCWERAMTLSIKLNQSFLSELQTRNDDKYDKQKEINKQKQTNKINAMKQVAEYGVENWQFAKEWGVENKLLYGIELDFINTAVHMADKAFPSEKQCARILDILEKMRKEGFPQ